MQKFLLDAFDLVRLRVKPLDHYVYEWWLPVLWLTLLSAVLSVFSVDLRTGVMQRMIFVIVFSWVQVILATVFLGWWQRLDKRSTQKGSLFPLLVLLGSIRLVLPIIFTLPDMLALPLILAVGIYSLVMLVVGLARATGAGIGHTIAGLLAFIPTGLILAMIAVQLLVNWGWVDPKQFEQQAPNPRSAAPLTQDNTTKPTQNGKGEIKDGRI